MSQKTISISIIFSLVISIAIAFLLNISFFPPKIDIQQVKADGEIPIYRSVGPGKDTALTTGATNNLTISGSVAIFDSALDNNIGVGDALQYDANGNEEINENEIAFIHGRTDATHYTIRDVAGAIITADLTIADNDWSIFRAYIVVLL